MCFLISSLAPENLVSRDETSAYVVYSHTQTESSSYKNTLTTGFVPLSTTASI